MCLMLNTWFLFLGDSCSDDDSNSRTNFSKVGEDDVDEITYQYLDQFDRTKVIVEARPNICGLGRKAYT